MLRNMSLHWNSDFWTIAVKNCIINIKPNCTLQVFGLGNSTYEYYNKMGKDTDELLEKRGAYKLSALGLGDDDGNIEDDYMNWREAFWADICKKFGVVKSEDNLQ